MSFSFHVRGHDGRNKSYDEAWEKEVVQSLITNLLVDAQSKNLNLEAVEINPPKWAPENTNTYNLSARPRPPSGAA